MHLGPPVILPDPRSQVPPPAEQHSPVRRLLFQNVPPQDTTSGAAPQGTAQPPLLTQPQQSIHSTVLGPAPPTKSRFQHPDNAGHSFASPTARDRASETSGSPSLTEQHSKDHLRQPAMCRPQEAAIQTGTRGVPLVQVSIPSSVPLQSRPGERLPPLQAQSSGSNGRAPALPGTQSPAVSLSRLQAVPGSPIQSLSPGVPLRLLPAEQRSASVKCGPTFQRLDYAGLFRVGREPSRRASCWPSCVATPTQV
ncbi:hypothetical protein NDU88_004668 [Pleurodeles waltl]|uniref:Uncharacterized protein n=1 Tax=Pleurodeles waltl TaxID=8319 RepID=A0AAV7T9T1_PLEWA|nr:hypothetical protein NDU88_004668 [Pleurodeles waltl]